MEETLDLRGLKCPLPALMTRRALARLPPQTRLTVMSDDALAAVDVPHMCHHEGHTVESVVSENGYTRFAIRRGSLAQAAAPPDPDG